MTKNPRPARPGSVLADVVPPSTPMSAAEAARIMRQAEAHPAMDVKALRVLRVMLFELGGYRSGNCTHALDAIAVRCKLSRATVVRRLRLLTSEAVGFIERTRRAVLVDARAGWRGAVRWAQTTTLYRFRRPPAPPQPKPVHSEAQAEPPMSRKNFPPLPPTNGWRASLVARAEREAKALEEALDRLGKQVRERAALSEWRPDEDGMGAGAPVGPAPLPG